MSDSIDHYFRAVISGARRGVAPTTLRAALRAIEPFYAIASGVRNALYDHGAATRRRLPRPVISIGNITAGGTGKTPTVRWLAGRLRDRGHQPAILSRGYKSQSGAKGDELMMLEAALDRRDATPIATATGTDRHAAALAALRQDPDIDLFIMDDGFQHRRLERDFDLVLINAVEPFGFDHVLPRGLLREPLRGLKRASAFVLTHVDRVSPETASGICQRLAAHNPRAPIYRASHAPTALRGFGQPLSLPPTLALDALRDRDCFAFCGLSSPDGFAEQVRRIARRTCGHRWFGDHHAYSAQDLVALRRLAADAGANVLVTTEKDWAKIASLDRAGANPPIWRLDIELRFEAKDEQRLLEQIIGAMPTKAI